MCAIGTYQTPPSQNELSLLRRQVEIQEGQLKELETRVETITLEGRRARYEAVQALDAVLAGSGSRESEAMAYRQFALAILERPVLEGTSAAYRTAHDKASQDVHTLLCRAADTIMENEPESMVDHSLASLSTRIVEVRERVKMLEGSMDRLHVGEPHQIRSDGHHSVIRDPAQHRITDLHAAQAAKDFLSESLRIQGTRTRSALSLATALRESAAVESGSLARDLALERRLSNAEKTVEDLARQGHIEKSAYLRSVKRALNAPALPEKHLAKERVTTRAEQLVIRNDDTHLTAEDIAGFNAVTEFFMRDSLDTAENRLTSLEQGQSELRSTLQRQSYLHDYRNAIKTGAAETVRTLHPYGVTSSHAAGAAANTVNGIYEHWSTRGLQEGETPRAQEVAANASLHTAALARDIELAERIARLEYAQAAAVSPKTRTGCFG